MTTETKTAFFQISGADFTRLARERVLDDAPDGAWRLASCLLGDGEDRDEGVADAALGILKGTKKLVGDTTNMKIVKESPSVTKEYRERVAWLYAGRIKVYDKWYRPVAYISNFGRNDLRNSHNKPVARLGSNLGYSNRAWHYVGNNEIYIEAASYKDPESPHLERDVIFEVCSERPHWLDAYKSPQAAVDEFVKLRGGLEERGHVQLYGDDPDARPSDRADVLDYNDHAVVHDDRQKRERRALENGDVSLMNERIAAELDFARELDEDDREGIQELRDDPQKGSKAKRAAVVAKAKATSPGVGVLMEMLDEYDPKAVEDMYNENASRLREEERIANLIEDDTAREQAYEQIDREQDELRQKRLVSLRKQILEQANGDLIELSWEDWFYEHDQDHEKPAVSAGKVLVPRAPFLHWAFARMKMFEDQLPAWRVISPPGLKMPMDDPYHTDWVIGAGLDPQARTLLYYPGPVSGAAIRLAGELQDQFDRVKAITVIVDGPWASGPVVHGKPNLPVADGAVVVLPNLHPRYLVSTAHAVAVICEEGGATAHLAQVSRERKLPIVRIADARKKYQEGMTVVVNTAEREVHEI